MLGSSSSNSQRDKYINTWIRVQYSAYALVQIAQKIKKLEK